MSIDIAKPLSAEDLLEKMMIEAIQHPEHTRQLGKKSVLHVEFFCQIAQAIPVYRFIHHSF